MATIDPSPTGLVGNGPAAPARPTKQRGWAVAGVLGGLAAVASIQLSMSAGPVYDPATPPTPEWIAQQLAPKVPLLIGFHIATTAAALLLMVFTAGLKRRLDAQAPADSLLGVSPLQYLAGFVGPIWLLVVALGFTFGDRR